MAESIVLRIIHELYFLFHRGIQFELIVDGKAIDISGYSSFFLVYSDSYKKLSLYIESILNRLSRPTIHDQKDLTSPSLFELTLYTSGSGAAVSGSYSSWFRCCCSMFLCLSFLSFPKGMFSLDF